MRYLTKKEKITLLEEWYSFMDEYPPISVIGRSGTGSQDLEIIEWCEKLNELPFLCTESSCAGHRYIWHDGEEVLSSGYVYIRLTKKAMRKFDKRVFRLAKDNSIENVSKVYTSWGKETICIHFAGSEHNCLDESMRTIYNFFLSLMCA